MLIYKGKLGVYNLESNPLARGGEGSVYNVKNNNTIVAKIYFNPTKELQEKLTYMANNQPDKSVLNDIAWPLDILYDNKGSFSGFIMPKMKTGMELGELYKFNLDKEPILTYQHRIVIAINICRVISAVHEAGYVFGDFNPANIGVDLKNGHVGFFDADSYHIHDKETGKTYRCGVCLNGYVAPELIQRCKGTNYLDAPLPTFTQETDRFSLAIHIFKLLMNGFTPFNGIKDSETISSSSPGIGNQAIERDNYCFKPGNKHQSLATPNLTSFPINIQKLFSRAFIDGKIEPTKRPTANEWGDALTNYLNNELKVCSKDKNHYYYKILKTCPYCEAEDRYKRNLISKQGQISFPTSVNVPDYSNKTASSSSYSNSSQAMTYYNSNSNINTTPPRYSGLTVYSNRSSNRNGFYKKIKNLSFPSKIILFITIIGLLLLGIVYVKKETKNPDNIKIQLVSKRSYCDTNDYGENRYNIKLNFFIKNKTWVDWSYFHVITKVYDFNGNHIGTITSDFGNYDARDSDFYVKAGGTSYYSLEYYSTTATQYDSDLFSILYYKDISNYKFESRITDARYILK